MSKAAAACGADGVIVEVHTKPERGVSDGEQSLTPEQFDELVRALRPILKAENRDLVLREEPSKEKRATA